MESVDVSHREIYDRLLAVELKVDSIEKNTAGVSPLSVAGPICA